MATMDYENENGRYDEEPRYDRERSASPRPLKRDDSYRGSGGRDRSASPGGRDRGAPQENRNPDERDNAARNTGSNLFVTGLPSHLNESEVTRMFEKYGEVENCSIMRDPHTQESRGFGFVKMVTAEQADAAREGLQGESINGRTLSIEKARRARPRTPTPGRYFGPPKREGGPPSRRDDRRGYGGGGYGRDDYYRSDDRRGYGGGRRDDYGSRGVDRYASGGRDRYGGRDYGRDGGREGGRDGGRDGGYGRDDRRDDRRGDDRRGDPYYSSGGSGRRQNSRPDPPAAA